MTLIAAGVHGDMHPRPGSVWMAGDRRSGGFDFEDLADPKVYRLPAGDTEVLIGLAGSPRVAQLVLSVELPDYDPSERSLHWWMAETCNRIGERCARLWALPASSEYTGEMAGYTQALVAVPAVLDEPAHVCVINSSLSWAQPARGWDVIGGACETFAGAFVAVKDEGWSDLSAMQRAWEIAQQFHHIGPPVDILEL